MKPLIRWVGGKRATATLIGDLWRRGKYKRLIEPFVGSAAVFFDIRPRQASLVDLCIPLTEFYMALRQFLPQVLSAWSLLLSTREPSDVNYYTVRRAFNETRSRNVKSAAMRAAQFLYLNRLGYHGLWRVNKSGHMNTPYGHYDAPHLPDRAEISESATFLNRARVYNADFATGFLGVQPTDFIYCDPPYFDAFDSYTSERFSLPKHKRLAERAEAARALGAMVVVSNRDCPAMRKLYPKSRWKRQRLGIVQRIAPQNGGKKPEMLFVGRV